MDQQAKGILLGIARQVVEAVVQGKPRVKLEASHPDLQGHQGAFVTLKTGGRLRGCIGVFEARRPLYQVVADMAADSALRDPRFVYDRIMPQELPNVRIEISVLSPLRRIEDPLDFELGKHGIYVKQGIRTGCFLPQVATETGWTKEEFLTHCCQGKAGISPDAWRDKATEVHIFTAEVISESE